MQFKPELAQKVLLSEKTMTRRLVKPGEFWDGKNVCRPDGVIKWRVGQTYAVQPGRGKVAIGRFKLLDIRRERVQDISEEDAIAEGVDNNCVGDPRTCPSCRVIEKCQFDDEWRHYLRGEDEEPAYSAVESFLSLFESINGKAALDKEVWVLTFEVEQAKPAQ